MNQIDLMRQVQIERCIGELNALKASYYDPSGNNKDYYLVREIIKNMIDELRSELG
ncbi:hypothetical protein [Clostridium ihumii]|uniref:hypothetical protein n=1 Tax=Clostridium ihumii TaxID=1470356 RepID=UPI000A53088A|nr:hypothetical protein [Clostridium ihumii]